MKKITFTLAAAALSLLASCTHTASPRTAPAPTGSSTPSLANKKYPVAHRYQNSKKIVISPYRPYNLIDLRGIKPGHLARDMSTAKHDPITGKPIESTAKIFLVPDLNAPVAATE